MKDGIAVHNSHDTTKRPTESNAQYDRLPLHCNNVTDFYNLAVLRALPWVSQSTAFGAAFLLAL